MAHEAAERRVGKHFPEVGLAAAELATPSAELAVVDVSRAGASSDAATAVCSSASE